MASDNVNYRPESRSSDKPKVLSDLFRRRRLPRPPRPLLPQLPARRGGVDTNALLGREPVELDTARIQRFLAGKRVLVTGAGGSIGSEICRQAMRYCPSRLVLVDRCEFGLFEIERELRSQWLGCNPRAVIGDICDEVRMDQVFHEERPQVVFHAAAHKHVPLMEQNPGEAIKVNVLGTSICARAAVSSGVDAFVLISTDKAVNPSSVMGATKRCAEMVVQAMSEAGPTRFCAVRFGNVLGSSGSVVPIFAGQIERGGPVTVTHPEMKRFFMTIPEAAGLVMQAGAFGEGGEIFVLDMGRQIPILELAQAMIRSAGLRVGEDVAIRFTGIRPGEKLEEELAGEGEATLPTRHAMIRVWQLPQMSGATVTRMLTSLAAHVDGSREQIVSALARVVPEFTGVEGLERPAKVDVPLPLPLRPAA